MTTLGPNTCFRMELMRPKLLICSGEDPGEASSVAISLLGRFESHHRFRAYELWSFEDIAFVVCGMGTGCVEPLLWEVFQSNGIRAVVLAGTAGRFPKSPTRVGGSYLISKAYAAATA